MAEEVRKRTDLERVHDKVFDPENGLEARVVVLEKDGEWIAKARDFWNIVKWPLIPVALSLLAQVGTWLATWVRGGQ